MSLYVVLGIVLGLVLPVAFAQAPAFSDIHLSNYPEAVRYLQQRGLVSGYPDGSFRPAGNVSRAELTALLMAEQLGEAPRASACFTDVTDQWYAGYVCAAKHSGVIHGYDEADGLYFKPNEAVSYAEALKLVIQTFGFPVEERGTSTRPEDGAWYAPYQDFVHYYAVLEEGSYHPDDALSRDAMAQLIYRAVVIRDNAALIAAIVPAPDAQGALTDIAPATITVDTPAVDTPVVDETTSTETASTETTSTEAAASPAEHSSTANDQLASLAVPAAPVRPAPAVTPNLSAGCGRPAPTPLASLRVGGRDRQLITVVPDSYDPNSAFKLVFAFHGRTNANHQVRRYYGIENHWTDALIVYPQGLPRGDGYSWSDVSDRASSLRDYALFDALLEYYSANYCLDLDHVYALGHSLGGWFSSSLGCARGDKLRAIASLGGSISISECQGNVAAMVIHNPSDRLVPVAQGEATRDLFLTQNNLALQARATVPENLRCERYGDAGTNTPVLWCPHTNDHGYNGRYYPHNWPNGTGTAILDFFASLP
ncbi:MAG: S-layer homology domain-containing protein [Deinococcota bacterium]